MTHLFSPLRRNISVLIVATVLQVWVTGPGAPTAHSGVFNLPHFVPAGDFAIGLEPELTLTNGAGVGVNAKYTHGITDWSNAVAILGTGSGPRGFRAGGDLTFDFFPDIEGQPGIGLGLQTLFIRIPTPTDVDAANMSGRVELTAIPYIHKTFVSGGNEFEPFIAIPIGMSFLNGQYQPMSTVVVGSMFKGSEKLRYALELGIAVNRTDTYLSGGITYYH